MKYTIWVFILQKYGKLGRVSLELFVKSTNSEIVRCDGWGIRKSDFRVHTRNPKEKYDENKLNEEFLHYFHVLAIFLSVVENPLSTLKKFFKYCKNISGNFGEKQDVRKQIFYGG